MLRVAERYVVLIEQWMRQHRPWTDRTGDARRLLWIEVFDVVGHAVVIVLNHGVDYGRYLETMQGGRYAIIAPAIDYWGPHIMREIQIELAQRGLV